MVKSNWRLVTSGVSRGSILGPVLFNVFMNDLDDEAECSLCKFVDDTKVGGLADTPEGNAAIQKNLSRLKKWAHESHEVQQGELQCPAHREEQS
ncbi:rna-directed dna polymerase from mobile element jockey-like [Limosa lapponica baueri]|uniref:Rna-directed dna polymerase from mobile element jockey-like n=1 Tax=Limosa lapponica baueri TaxID=1758121 RepID=A0A2I0UF92_LIMLA|nr:rna-directed dna polymerase from mobile element jockey-like [Limosa lapponica baueri]